MAISGGTIAAIVGALGVGGFLWWKKSKAAAGETPCQKMAKTAADLAGYEVNDLLAKSVCSGVDSLLAGGGVMSLPGPALLKSVLNTVFPSGSKVCMTCCPEGSAPVSTGRSLDLAGIVGGTTTVGGGLVDHRGTNANAWTCNKPDGTVVGILPNEGGFVPYTVNLSQNAGLPTVKPTKSISAIAGTSSSTLAGSIVTQKQRTTGGVSVT
jgi:hypothetical protein